MGGSRFKGQEKRERKKRVASLKVESQRSLGKRKREDAGKMPAHPF
jgi:hypothetical protein